jgi:S1-C subfamily serine protease
MFSMRPRVTSVVVVTLAAGVAGCVGDKSKLDGPLDVFERVESGVALLQPYQCHAKEAAPAPLSTGFLVGSQVVMTAQRVVADAIADGCALRVRLDGRWYGARAAKAWYDGRSRVQDVDLATLELTDPAPGHIFRFAHRLPHRRSTVLTIGHPRGLPLNLEQGAFRRAGVIRGVPSVVAWMVAGEGNTGGPILNEQGDAIGVVSSTTVADNDPIAEINFIGGADLTRWFTASASRDLCRAHPSGGVPDCPSDSDRPGPRRSLPLKLRAGTDTSATGLPNDAAVSTDTLGRVMSGVARIRPTDCGGVKGPWPRPPGFFATGATGFLVGPRVVMTAKHVVPAGCRSEVQLGGRWYDTTEAKAWYDARSKFEDVDLVTLRLTERAPGYVFRFAQATPSGGDAVATIGHPLGLPLNFQRGLFRRTRLFRGFRMVVARVVTEGGNSGGPIINSDGDVIGLVSRSPVPDEDPGDSSLIGGPDLTHWFAASANSDLCRAYPGGGIRDCPAEPARKGPRRWLTLKPRRS